MNGCGRMRHPQSVESLRTLELLIHEHRLGHIHDFTFSRHDHLLGSDNRSSSAGIEDVRMAFLASHKLSDFVSSSIDTRPGYDHWYSKNSCNSAWTFTVLRISLDRDHARLAAPRSNRSLAVLRTTRAGFAATETLDRAMTCSRSRPSCCFATRTTSSRATRPAQ